LKTALVHSLLLGFFGFFWYLILGPKGPGLVLLSYVAGLSGLAFRRIFGRVERK
jgi:hypothetical protein